jgi:hypothetical protein
MLLPFSLWLIDFRDTIDGRNEVAEGVVSRGRIPTASARDITLHFRFGHSVPIASLVKFALLIGAPIKLAWAQI